ncbi:MAG: ABC transporter permease [Candidatus Marinimicrobia bacterium]|nr:ABC transporter permease [Candidatus Neomarinimicrobiota bacterium]
MIVFWFLIREGFRGLVRSKFAGAFTILIVWITLTILGIGYIVSRDMVNAVNSLRAQFDINIFLEQTANQQDIKEFASHLKSVEEVGQYKFISKSDAAEKFKDEFGKDILTVLDHNPLPPSFNVQLKPVYRNLASVESITSDLSKFSIVDEIKYKKNFLIILEKYQRAILYIITGTFLLFGFISIVLISNTIKMAIFSRRNIISTMKLLGATNNFVRAPFVIEGILQGFIGASLASLVLYGLSYLLNNHLQSIIQYTVEIDLPLFIAIIVFGILMGLTGSIRAIRKFL